MKEELLLFVWTRTKVLDRVRRWSDLLLEIAFSESEELAEDFGGEGCSETEMRSYAFLVRRIGPLFSKRLRTEPSFVFLGRVRAQFSHGIARFLSFSSYVLRKLESLLCRPCKLPTLGDSDATRGDCGGVSIIATGDCGVAPKAGLGRAV